MWVFYLISLPLTLGMVFITLRYFAGPDVPRYVFFTVGYTWFCSLSIIILVPADIWATILDNDKGGIAFLWGWSYWSTFILTWVVAPTIQGYEDAGDFTVRERLKTSIHENIFYLIVGSVGLFGLVLLVVLHKNWWSGGIVGLAMACSNTFGLVTGAFLLGFGLSEIPKSIWRNADWATRQKVLSHKVAKMAMNLDNAHQELSNAIVIAQSTSKQMSKRDPLKPYMDVIDDMLLQMFREDPAFKPTGGRLGQNDMDYDADEKSLATLRRQLRIAREKYYRYRSEYTTYVAEALELEETIKNYGHGNSSGWKFVSSLRSARTGPTAPYLDTLEWIWRCILRKQFKKVLAVMLGCMSVAILLAEATLVPNGVDLSLFSILIKAAGKREMLVQIAAFLPLVYMCVCTYYSLFKVGMLMLGSLTPRQTSSVILLMICSMVARYAAPISYNFLNLIRLGGNAKTTFEKVNLKNKEEHYQFVWDIVDNRWDNQMHKPLHAVGLYLNPGLYYDNKEIEYNPEIKDGLFHVIFVLCQNTKEQSKITTQLLSYRGATRPFGMELAIKARKECAPAEWWLSFGYGCRELQRLAIRVLSLTCSATPCERNWSTFEMLMGNIDDAVPFFGEGFNKIYPLIMVIYTLLVASNFFDRIISVFGNWRKRIFRDDAEDMDGLDPSGVIILQKERLWLAQGSNLGEHIFPLARNFNGMSADVEAGSVAVNFTRDEIKSMTGNLSMDEYKGSHSKALKDDKTSRHTSSKESIGSKYAAYRDQQRKQFKASASVSLLDVSDSRDDHNSREDIQSPSRLANTWASMKRNFANVGANLGVKKFLVPQQTHEAESNPRDFPSESLDEIFGRFKSRTEGGTR